jgi:hypothetical protein
MCRFRGKLHCVRDRRRTAPIPVARPHHRHIQLPVDQRPPLGRGITQKSADLTVLSTPSRTRILSLHTSRTEPLLQETSLVNDQHPVRVAQVLHHVLTHVVANQIRIPCRTLQEILQTVGGPEPRRLRQRPPILALQRRQQATHVRERVPTRLHPGKPARETREQILQLQVPRLDYLNCHHSRQTSQNPLSRDTGLQY